jgi:HSP20 family protein
MNRGLSLWRDPWAEMDRFLDTINPTRNTSALEAFNPACDIEEDENHYTLSFDVPGLAKEDIHLEVANNQLIVSGERKREEKKNRDGYSYAERSYGKFHRIMQLPTTIDADKIEAHYDNGVLQVSVPKVQSAKSRNIQIGARSDKTLSGKANH